MLTDWQEQGLNPSQIVLEQVTTYKTEMDSIALFVKQGCSLEPETKYSASKLYETYRHFCQAKASSSSLDGTSEASQMAIQ